MYDRQNKHMTDRQIYRYSVLHIWYSKACYVTVLKHFAMVPISQITHNYVFLRTERCDKREQQPGLCGSSRWVTPHEL